MADIILLEGCDGDCRLASSIELFTQQKICIYPLCIHICKTRDVRRELVGCMLWYKNFNAPKGVMVRQAFTWWLLYNLLLWKMWGVIVTFAILQMRSLRKKSNYHRFERIRRYIVNLLNVSNGMHIPNTFQYHIKAFCNEFIISILFVALIGFGMLCFHK